MSRKLWFGKPGHMKQIKMPQGGINSSMVGYSESVQYLSGRKSVLESLGGHMEYEWTWRGTRDDVQHLLDCSDGVYGRQPFYFIDPMVADRNVLPAHWATPSLGAYDAPPIYGNRRPEAVPASANDGTWPAEGARFTRDAAHPRISVYIPIPPGHAFHFWYAGTAGVVRLERRAGKVAQATTTPTARNMTQRLIDQAPTIIANDGTVDGVVVYVTLPSGTNSATIYGMRAIVVPGTVAVGKPRENMPASFVAGRGHSGVSFETKPSVTPYSLPYDSIGVTARLVEADY